MPPAARRAAGRPLPVPDRGRLVALAVLTLYFKLDIGFVSLTIALALTLIAPDLQKRALGRVSWPRSC